MPQTTASQLSSESTVLLVDLPRRLKQDHGVANPPPITTLRTHGYDLRFNFVRLENGKLAVLEKDLPAIAALYARQGNVRAAA